MSAIVQLSYNINEKLRLDDRTFTAYGPHHKSEGQTTPVSKSTSFTTKEACEQWPTSSSGAGTTQFVDQTVTTSSTSNVSSDKCFGASGAVVGVSCQRFDHQRTIHRRDIKPVALVRTSAKDEDNSLTTVIDLRECTSQKHERKPLSSAYSRKKEKFSMPKKSPSFVFSTEEPSQCKLSTTNEAPETDTFPSIVGRSCTLHPVKKFNSTSGTSSLFADVPPNKKHCRSVSEPDDLVDVSKYSQFSMPWKPGAHSRVWVPISRLHPQQSRRALSASSYPGRTVGNCSRSIDCGSLNSGTSVSGGSLLTPPTSPVPRPASVTVIKQEGGAWTFLSSQQLLSHQHQGSSFSPLLSPSSMASPSSARLQDEGSRAWSQSGLSATKRSLSFSDDFEHRESVEYTPTSTPEFERRFDQNSRYGGLLRCQSHPSDLNLKRGKGRRKSRLCHNRPTLDFAKMKQTSFNKRNRCKERNLSGSKNSYAHTSNGWSSLPSDLGEESTVRPVFPSIIASESHLKKSTLVNSIQNKIQPTPSLSPPFMSFSIGCSTPLCDIQRRIPSPTDEIPTDADDDMMPETNIGTSSGGVMPLFMRECHDLDINEIENET